MFRKLIDFSISNPRLVIIISVVLTLLFAFEMRKIKIDTDPENMLEEHQKDRVFYDKVKKEFGVRDMLVLGIENEKGIFQPDSLKQIQTIVSEILKMKGVITEDVMSFTTTNDVAGEGGLLEVKRIMESAPSTKWDADILKQSVLSNPLFNEKLASKDGTAIAVYVPIEKKDISYKMAESIRKIADKHLGSDTKYYLAGLPMAEDTFGHEMFVQMGIVAPLAGMAIFIILLLLFKKLSLIISSMAVAMMSVIWGMGLLISTGNTVHIMSSMIPVFLMPIAVLDAVHILSSFYDQYPHTLDRKKTIHNTMEELFTAMLYTSLTSAVGFGSLAFADIPPVRVFGIFVAFGIMAAWLLTITVIPASIMLLDERKLSKSIIPGLEEKSILNKFLPCIGSFTFHKAKQIITVSIIVLGIGIYGLTRIHVNDNPVKWFKESHPIRQADTAMNRLFGGTYMAYLTFKGTAHDHIKNPEVIKYIEKLQNELVSDKFVGKTSSIADIVKRINFILHDRDNNFHILPDSKEEISQYLFLYLMSGSPDDLDNFVDYNYQDANIWVQLKSGENKDMEKVEKRINNFMLKNPPPQGISVAWSGLTYINKVWQDIMVKGMLEAVLGGFVIVLIMMIFLFRSIKLGFISMIPLTFSIVLSYALIGLFGRDYDMPIAVCSSLALGLAVDFAIHFIQRYKQKQKEGGTSEKINTFIFGETARAISRNAIVIVLGFLPLVISNLTPYITVGVFFALLMSVSTIITLLLLPGLMRLVNDE